MVVLPQWHCKVERGVRYSFSGLEILHGGEGGDVELGARTSEHILSLCLIHCLSTLSLFCAKHHSFIHILLLAFVPCIISYCSSLYAWLACVCLTYT